jgi:hypothetical protein
MADNCIQKNIKPTANYDDMTIYNKMVDFCEKGKITDYCLSTPLICYTNRVKFLKMLSMRRNVELINK